MGLDLLRNTAGQHLGVPFTICYASFRPMQRLAQAQCL